MDNKEYKILLFGVTRDILGSESGSVSLPEGSSVYDLRTKLIADFPALGKLNSLMIAVNNEYAEDSTLINSSDEIALIPPVSGG